MKTEVFLLEVRDAFEPIGDRLNLKYNLTEGFDAVNISYTFLAVKNNLSIEYSNGNSGITQSDFSDFGIRADAETVSFQFERSLVRQSNQDVDLFVAIDRRSSNTFIEDDLPLSFTEGPQDGRYRKYLNHHENI